MRIFLYFLPLLYFLFISCSTEKRSQTFEEEEMEELHTIGDSLANKAQLVLLKKLTSAIEKNGTAYAISFCNTKAIALNDSLSDAYQVKISRITDQPRNIDNLIHSYLDKQMYESFRDNPKLYDTITQNNHTYVYYKRINMALPTCIRCHGVVGEDIHHSTQKTLRTYYPQDQATGYKLNDYRALWKIEFEKKF
ncbi:c-type heme family protein [Vaginella massiliensis]|uniref:c-type heme family protein n=1 Tax=Vaginella massiliensis TaxID=1816680 RepID=UPI0012B60596|nr:DUF3365 domain-containing protein [Vaginella massiliensis]